MEIFTVYRDSVCNDLNKFDKHTIDGLVLSYVTSIVQVRLLSPSETLYNLTNNP